MTQELPQQPQLPEMPDVGKASELPSPVPAVEVPAPTPETTLPVPGVEDLPPLSAEEAEAVQKAVQQVDLMFPEIGFIDPTAELQKVRAAANKMTDDERKGYPDKIRAAILAHEGDKKKYPAVTDEEMCLAIYLQRLHASTLTEEDIEAKATGRKKSAAKTAEEKAAAKEAKKKDKAVSKLDELFGGAK
jgi:hypothetical protein